MLEVENLSVEVLRKRLLKGFSISLKAGECHVIMGPNGAGKSTFSNMLAGDPKYKVREGKVVYDGVDLLSLSPDKRAALGLFVSPQHPVEIPSLSNFEFLKEAFRAREGSKWDEKIFEGILREKMEAFSMDGGFLKRGVNAGFSGGEKKRYEIFQMELFSPRLVVLDEIDSGLDIDSFEMIAGRINAFRSKGNCFIIITHYPRILKYIKADFIHVIKDGTVVRRGGADVVDLLEKGGYGSI